MSPAFPRVVALHNERDMFLGNNRVRPLELPRIEVLCEESHHDAIQRWLSGTNLYIKSLMAVLGSEHLVVVILGQLPGTMGTGLDDLRWIDRTKAAFDMRADDLELFAAANSAVAMPSKARMRTGMASNHPHRRQGPLRGYSAKFC